MSDLVPRLHVCTTCRSGRPLAEGETAPEPTPDMTPQVATSCHDWVINRLSAVATDISTSAPSSVRRTPMRSISAAANGPTSP